jgi:hypothetical protein
MLRSKRSTILVLALCGVFAACGGGGGGTTAKKRVAAKKIKGKVNKQGRAANANAVAIKSQKTNSVIMMVDLGADGSFVTPDLPHGDKYGIEIQDDQGAQLGDMNFDSGSGGGQEEGIPFLDQDGKADDVTTEFVEVDVGMLSDDPDGEGFLPSVNPLSELDADGDGEFDLADDDDDDDGTGDEEDNDDDGDGLPDDFDF